VAWQEEPWSNDPN
jgi:hypothetical protein